MMKDELFSRVTQAQKALTNDSFAIELGLIELSRWTELRERETCRRVLSKRQPKAHRMQQWATFYGDYANNCALASVPDRARPLKLD